MDKVLIYDPYALDELYEIEWRKSRIDLDFQQTWKSS